MNAKNSRVTVHTDCVGVMIGEIEMSTKHTAVVDAYKINPFDLCLQVRRTQKNVNDIHSVSNNIICHTNIWQYFNTLANFVSLFE